MRGKALSHICCCRVSWITPAYAGKSKPSWSGQACMAGSPPPMRGKGKSKTCLPRFLPDHPRLCGEKFWICWKTFVLLGSPPPMRGKADCMTFCRFRRRITPAYAGKSSLFPRSSVILEDHPRLCGEKPPSACTGGRCGGSPPPMRGKDLSAGQLRRNHRITPAYAGKRSLTLRR